VPLLTELTRERNFPRSGRVLRMPACNEQRSSMPVIEEAPMNGIIYLVGLIVIIMFILSFLGLR